MRTMITDIGMMHRLGRFSSLVILAWLTGIALASAQGFGLIVCAVDDRGELAVTIADVTDSRINPDGIGPWFSTDPIGRSCPVVLGELLDADFEILFRDPINTDADCDLWDFLGTDIIGGTQVFGFTDCEVGAPGGPTIKFIQTDAELSSTGLLATAVGRQCSAFMVDLLATGGRYLGHTIIALDDSSSRNRKSRRNSILFELQLRSEH